MVMPPPFKQTNKSESGPDEPKQSSNHIQQSQQPKPIQSQLVRRTNSDGILRNDSVDSLNDPIKSENSPTTKLPPTLHPIKVTSANYKGVTPIISGQPGAQSVFFTSAKLVAQTIASQVAKAGSPTTAQGTFAMSQNAKTIEKKQQQSTAPVPPTLLFRAGQPLTQVRNLQPAQLQSIKTVTPIITNGQVLSATNNIILQPVGQDSATIKLEGNMVSTTNSTSAAILSSPLLIPATANAMQTVSVIKQQAVSADDVITKDMKPFTSITDILSSKDSKVDLLASKNLYICNVCFPLLLVLP